MTAQHLRNAIVALLVVCTAGVVVAGMYKFTLWQAEQRQSLIHEVAGVDHRLRVLESNIVGQCSPELPMQFQPNCEKGWRREQMEQYIARFCEDNSHLVCTPITEKWPDWPY